MSTLLRFAWRELLRARGRLGLIALILALQVAALGGGYVTQESLYYTRDLWSEKLQLADLDVRFTAASVDEMPSIEALREVPGVLAVTRRFVALGHIERAGSERMPVVVMYVDPAEHPAVNDIEVLSGQWLTPGKPEAALVDRSFASAHGLAFGDEIVVNPGRLSSRFTVEGVGLSPEYLVPTANPDLLVPRKGSLGIIYASHEALDRAFPDRLYNDVAIRFQPDADPRKTTDAVLAALGPLQIERIASRKQTFTHRFLDVMLAGSRSVTPIVAGIVALMAAIVALTSVHRLIAERRREIGCLLAQGYSRGELAACFFGIGLAPGAVGAVLGVPAAIFFAGRMTQTTANILGFPDPIMAWSAKWLGLAASSALIVGVLSAIPPTLTVLRMHPSMALRGTSDIVLTRLPRVLEALLASCSTSVRYAFRNVLRRVPLSVATISLIALAVGLPAGLLTTISSWDAWAQGGARNLEWDGVAVFKAPLSDENVNEIVAGKGVAQWEGYTQGYGRVRLANGATLESRIRGFKAEGNFVRDSFVLSEGRWFSSDDAAEAIVDTSFMGDSAPRIGDAITVLQNGAPRRLVVVGLMASSALAMVLVPRHLAQTMFGLEGKSNGAFLRFGGPVTATPAAHLVRKAGTASNAEVLESLDDVEGALVQTGPVGPVAFGARDTKTALLEEELVSALIVRTEYLAAMGAFVSSFKVVVIPFVALSCVLTFLFLVSVLGFLLLERETEYATLRSMGYVAGEIAQVVLVEVGALASAGLLLSLGAWALTASALRAPMTKTWFWIPLEFRFDEYAMAAVPTLIVLVLAALPGIRALMRLDLSSTLRGRAIG